MRKKILFLITLSSVLLMTQNVAAKDKDGDDNQKTRDESREHKQKSREQNQLPQQEPEEREQRRHEKQEERQQERQSERKIEKPDREVKKPFDLPSAKEQERTDHSKDYQVRDRREASQPRQQPQKEGEPSRSSWEKLKDDFKQSVESKRSQDADQVRDGKRVDVRFSKDRVKVKESRWSDRGRAVRRRFEDQRRRNHIFDDYYWNRFRSRHQNWYFNKDFSWSRRPSWPNVVVWLPWKWNRPVYYFYSEDGSIYYSDNPDFNAYIPIRSNEDFFLEAFRLANSSRVVARDQANWMPLGRFALSQDTDSSDMPQEYISLAISKDGAITGAYVNINDNIPVQIEGAVDDRSQRIAWKFIGQDWPIMETGLYNLTKEESTVLIHLSRFKRETRVLVRVE